MEVGHMESIPQGVLEEARENARYLGNLFNAEVSIVADMHEGDVGYTVPWMLARNKDGILCIVATAIIRPVSVKLPYDTDTMRVECRGGKYWVANADFDHLEPPGIYGKYYLRADSDGRRF
jgi:hypothetical protein